jgi:N-acetylglucosaminyldiphosphoundecaprenol N-acetyl-beta-D-mannosaminyltransferase
LYLIARQAPLTQREWLGWLAVMSVLGIYLALTAVGEITKQWELVFPRYIADPTLGIHFGRARGPELNSASLGVYLTACAWCAWTLRGHVRRGWQLLLLASLPLMAVGVFFTYTRSTWLGFLASGMVVVATELPRRWRLPVFALATLGGVLVAAFVWNDVVELQREGTATESYHSVDQRKSFAYVSWQMFKDQPIFGVGFGRFFDRKLPYLSDRSQEFELDSLRPLDHHNTLLSLLTETGMLGLAAFLGLVAAWARTAWSLARAPGVPRWIHAHGVLMLAMLATYLASALFHDLTLLPSQHWLLFMCAGLTVNLRLAANPGIPRATSLRLGEGRGAPCTYPRRSPRPSLEALGVPPSETVDLFGMRISRVTMRDAVGRVLGWCGEPRGNACRYVVTPNVDHVVMFPRRPELRAAYAAASLVLADGAPLVVASRLLGQRLPERVAGSDLVPRLFDAASEPLRVFLLGAAPGVAELAAERIGAQWPAVRVVGTYSPPPGFEHVAAENNRVLAAVADAAPDLLIVGLGAPKQELWVHRFHGELRAKVALCAGATIDFLAGSQRRSPVWMRRAGLEWLHRFASEPRRLAGRYARDAWEFPQLLWREWRRLYS